MTAEVGEMALEDEHLSSTHTECILGGWTSMKTEVQKRQQHYRSFKDEIAITDRIAIKVKRINIPASLQERANTMYILIIWA